jgi:hypothetical protein
MKPSAEVLCQKPALCGPFAAPPVTRGTVAPKSVNLFSDKPLTIGHVVARMALSRAKYEFITISCETPSNKVWERANKER